MRLNPLDTQDLVKIGIVGLEKMLHVMDDGHHNNIKVYADGRNIIGLLN